MKPGIILLLAAGVLFFMMEKKGAQPTGSPVTLTTDQKRKAINSWWETSTAPNDQASDNGRFEDIINSISAPEIDTIYTYIFSYVQQGTRPPVNSDEYNKIQSIINQYQIFQ